MITVEKLDNQLIIRLPPQIARQVRFKSGMKLDIDVLVDQIQIRPAGTGRRRSQYRLSDLLKKWNGQSPHKRAFDVPLIGRELI